MAVDEKTKAAVSKDSLSLAPNPLVNAIEAIEAEPYVDSTGEDSLEVWVVLNEGLRDEDVTGESVMQIKSAIRESLIDHGIRLFPYVHLVSRSDYLAARESA